MSDLWLALVAAGVGAVLSLVVSLAAGEYSLRRAGKREHETWLRRERLALYKELTLYAIREFNWAYHLANPDEVHEPLPELSMSLEQMQFLITALPAHTEVMEAFQAQRAAKFKLRDLAESEIHDELGGVEDRVTQGQVQPAMAAAAQLRRVCRSALQATGGATPRWSRTRRPPS